MIYSQPSELSPVDQGDIIDDCPVAIFEALPDPRSKTAEFTSQLRRVYVLTQACDLAQRKAASVVVAVVIDADQLVASGQLKAADVRGPIRAGRVHGWYFLPRSPALGLPESIVDFRTLHRSLGCARRAMSCWQADGASRITLPRTPRPALRTHLRPDRLAAAVRDAVRGGSAGAYVWSSDQS